MTVWLGPDTHHMVPATNSVNNHLLPMEIENEHFVGRVLVRVRDYGGQKSGLRTPEVSYRRASRMRVGGRQFSTAVATSIWLASLCFFVVSNAFVLSLAFWFVSTS